LGTSYPAIGKGSSYTGMGAKVTIADSQHDGCKMLAGDELCVYDRDGRSLHKVPRLFLALLLTALLPPPGGAQQTDPASVQATNAPAPAPPTLAASPPDAPMPDLGSVPGPSDASKSAGKRALDRLMPRCLDGLFHTCWAQPPGNLPASASKADYEFAKQMEIANLYFKDKNWAGAESRLREALAAQPTNPEATFKLARSLDKLGKSNDAREMYQRYMSLQPNGVYAKDAADSLARFAKQGKTTK
jgi:tetratricopeptide (TPR) repeat protein